MKAVVSLLVTVLSFNAIAQRSNSLGEQMLYLTEHLGFSSISSGILFDRGIQATHPESFDGSPYSDSTYSFDDWFLQYGSMVTGTVSEFPQIDSTAQWKPAVTSHLDKGIVPLMAIHVDYHKVLKDSSLFNESFDLHNGQLYDVANHYLSFEFKLLSHDPTQNLFFPVPVASYSCILQGR